MKRTKILSLILIMALLTVSFVSCGGDATKASESDTSKGPTYSFRLATMTTETQPITISAKRFAEKVKKATNGDVEITVYPASQLGDYVQVYDELKMGTIDFAWISVPDTYDKRVNIGVIPYIVMDYDDVEKLYFDENAFFLRTMKQINDEQGVTMLGVLPSDFYGVGAQKLGDINTLFDMDVPQDALIRSAPIDAYVATVEALKFRTITIPYADLYSALQTGVADGWYGGGATSNYLRFRDVIKYFVWYKAMVEPIGMLMSSNVFSELSPEYQKIILDCGKEEAHEGLEYIKTAEAQAMKDMKDYGITVIEPTDEELARVAASVREKVYPQYVDVYGPELMEELNAWVANLD